MTNYCKEHEKIYETHCPDCELVDLVTTRFEEIDMPESADVTKKCPTCGGLNKSLEYATACPECGCPDFINEGLVGEGYRECKNCGQDWWLDVKYAIGNEPCPDCAEKPKGHDIEHIDYPYDEKPEHIAEEETDRALIRHRMKELESASEKPDLTKCVRCGRCCMHMHTDDTGMPCESLLIKDGMATCLCHEHKPDVCYNYPDHPDFDGDPCAFNRPTYYDQTRQIAELKAKLEAAEEKISICHDQHKIGDFFINDLYEERQQQAATIDDIITTLAKLYHASAGENIVFRMLPESVMAEVKRKAKEK